MIQAAKGVRYDSDGKIINHYGRSLKGISESKVHPEYEYQNIKQQAGFSGELIKEARDNKANILTGNENRTRTSDGIGKTNDQRHDHLIVDKNNNVIENTGSQMKMIGRYETEAEIQQSSEQIIHKVMGKKFEKYKDGSIDIPSEQYERAVKYADDRIRDLKAKSEQLRLMGDSEKADLLLKNAEEFMEAKDKLRNSNVSSEEAMLARTNYKKFVTEEVLNDSHNAGVKAAKGAFLMSASISGARNCYNVIKGDKKLDEAIIDVSKDVAASSGIAYLVASGGTAIKSVMHSSSNSALRAVGNTNAPALIATATIEVSKSIVKYTKGEINEVELLEELGEKGTGMVAASYGAAVGTAIMPGVGTVIGGMIGYTVSSILYTGTLTALKDAELSVERRAIIESMNEECIRQMDQYHNQLIKEYTLRTNRELRLFKSTISTIDKGIFSNDIQMLCTGVNNLGTAFGVKFEFSNLNEFDAFMNDNETTLKL